VDGFDFHSHRSLLTLRPTSGSRAGRKNFRFSVMHSVLFYLTAYDTIGDTERGHQVNKEVNLTKRIKTSSGLRFCPVVLANNGRVKPDYVTVDGRTERHAEGSYYIEWYEGDKRIRQSVGKDAISAAARRHRQEQILASQAAGIRVLGDKKGCDILLVNAVNDYLNDTRLTKKPRTYTAYKLAMDYFLESCSKRQYLVEVDRRDLLHYAAFLRDVKNLSPRSVRNKFGNVMSFLKANGVRGLANKNDWPRYTEEEPEIYEQEKLDQFFAACTADERVQFEFFLMTGMRYQEVMHCCWPDVDLNQGVVRVRAKPQWGFSPKTYEEREVLLPQRLVKQLKAWKAKSNPACELVFPTSGYRPQQNFLDTCKVIAKRAKLNPETFWLHKFRATFATRHLWGGVDLRTVQSWLGHKDMVSTMRYLKPNRSQAVRDKANATWG
jgi:integrase/recombinase XerD